MKRGPKLTLFSASDHIPAYVSYLNSPLKHWSPAQKYRRPNSCFR